MAEITGQGVKSKAILIHGVTKIDAEGEITDFWLLARGGVIEQIGVGDGWTQHTVGAILVDGEGNYLTPGFLDIHFHGGGGHSNEDGPDAIESAIVAHRRHGTTRAVVSLVSNSIPTLLEKIASIAELVGKNPAILGSHLEGPYLAEERKGAHNAAHLIDPTARDVRDLIRAAKGTLRQITIDPARPGALEAIETFTSAGITVAIGHTSSDYKLALKAFAVGARLLTHAFNAMPGINHRDPGPIVAALETPGVSFELILDGKHVDPRVAALLMNAAPHRVALITDAMAAASSTDGTYKLGDVDVVVVNGTATILGSSTLAGSTLTLDRALQIGIDAGINRIDLIEALTLTPARILNVNSHLGLLRPSFMADLVLLDHDWNVKDVFVGGHLPT